MWILSWIQLRINRYLTCLPHYFCHTLALWSRCTSCTIYIELQNKYWGSRKADSLVPHTWDSWPIRSGNLWNCDWRWWLKRRPWEENNRRFVESRERCSWTHFRAGHTICTPDIVRPWTYLGRRCLSSDAQRCHYCSGGGRGFWLSTLELLSLSCYPKLWGWTTILSVGRTIF